MAILDVLNASRPFSPFNIEELVLNHCTLLEPSVPPVTIPFTVILLFSLRSPTILTFVTFGGAGNWAKIKSVKNYRKIIMLCRMKTNNTSGSSRNSLFKKRSKISGRTEVKVMILSQNNLSGTTEIKPNNMGALFTKWLNQCSSIYMKNACFKPSFSFVFLSFWPQPGQWQTLH